MRRRSIIKGLSTLPIIGLIACKSKGQTDEREMNTQVGSETEVADVTAGTEVSMPAGAEAGTSVGDETEVEWASGQTNLIEVAYLDDALFDMSNSCALALSTSTTKGPCYFKDETGEDISLGLVGLPMQLCLKLVDADCQPLSNHIIEVWHCDIYGVYSGDLSESRDSDGFATSFCTGDIENAVQSTWYRGQLVSNEQGRVNFKSQFPGWYPGRTVHIHFAVSDVEGNSRLISQFCFSDALADEVYTQHPLYRERGGQDTPLSRDGVFPSSYIEPFIFKTKKNRDGSLLAYQTIKVL